jgi:hypothetical protein
LGSVLAWHQARPSGVSRASNRRRLAFEPAVAVRRAHHGDLDALIAQSGDTSGPFSFDHAAAFELKAELAKEIKSSLRGHRRRFLRRPSV